MPPSTVSLHFLRALVREQVALRNSVARNLSLFLELRALLSDVTELTRLQSLQKVTWHAWSGYRGAAERIHLFSKSRRDVMSTWQVLCVVPEINVFQIL